MAATPSTMLATTLELGTTALQFAPSGCRLEPGYFNRSLRFPEDAAGHVHLPTLPVRQTHQDELARWGLSYPICYDESQAVPKRCAPACTPDFYLFDSARDLVYRGQLDERRPGNGKPRLQHRIAPKHCARIYFGLAVN
jgi:hypothetical protein